MRADWGYTAGRVEASPYCSVPLISEALSDELFAPQGGGDVLQMQKEIWADIRADLDRDLRGLEGACPDDLRRHLHRIRGYVSTASLQRLSEILLAWERAPDPGQATNDFLPAALEACERSIAEVERKYPQLVVPPQGPG